jgi:hypothetical protein
VASRPASARLRLSVPSSRGDPGLRFTATLNAAASPKPYRPFPSNFPWGPAATVLAEVTVRLAID